MAQVEEKRATLEDLYREPGKAELIDGRLVRFPPTGLQPNQIAGRIYRRLADYADETGKGAAYTDNMGFTVARLPSGRQSFSPDAAYLRRAPSREPYVIFVEEAPTLAVEVRSEADYGRSAEDAMAAKRADYFAAGTRVVWDVDTVDEEVRVYRLGSPSDCAVYGRGDSAEAEPAVPGWTLDLGWLFQ